MAFSWLFRGFFVALFCLEKQCLGLFRGFFVVFSWLSRGPRFGQNLRVPKGPFRTKNSTESKFTTARKKRYGNSKTLRIVLRSACFSMKKRQKNGMDSKRLRRYGFGRRTIFSTEGSFGYSPWNSLLSVFSIAGSFGEFFSFFFFGASFAGGCLTPPLLTPG